MAHPIVFTWTGDSFTPYGSIWAGRCDERFVVGERYTLDEVHPRSSATHAHYFATLHEIWQSLPDPVAARFDNEEQMRKHALISTGFNIKTQHACKSVAEAERLASIIRPYDTYQIVTVDGSIVTVYSAVSQDHRNMDKATFQKSKEAVLQWCADLLGTDRKNLPDGEQP